jgi:hypothetical protein
MDQIFYFVQELVLVVRRLELAFFSCVGYCLHILSWNQDNLVLFAFTLYFRYCVGIHFRVPININLSLQCCPVAIIFRLMFQIIYWPDSES